MLFDVLCCFQKKWCGTGMFSEEGIGTHTFDDPSNSLFLPCSWCQPVMCTLTHRIWDLKYWNQLNIDFSIMSDDHSDAWGLMVLAPYWADSSLLSRHISVALWEITDHGYESSWAINKETTRSMKRQTERECRWVLHICKCLLFKVCDWEIYRMKGSEKDSVPCWLCLSDFRIKKKEGGIYHIAGN